MNLLSINPINPIRYMSLHRMTGISVKLHPSTIWIVTIVLLKRRRTYFEISEKYLPFTFGPCSKT